MADIEIFIENEKEWRKYIINKLDKIEAKQDIIQEKQNLNEKSMNTLKIKVALFIAFFSGGIEGIKHWIIGK